MSRRSESGRAEEDDNGRRDEDSSKCCGPGIRSTEEQELKEISSTLAFARRIAGTERHVDKVRNEEQPREGALLPPEEVRARADARPKRGSEGGAGKRRLSLPKS